MVYYYLTQKDIVEGVKLHAEKIKKFINSSEKEPYFIRAKTIIKILKNIYWCLKKIKKFLEILNSNPKSSWNKHFENFDISVNDFTPLHDLKIKFENGKSPEWVGIDLNYDNTISKKDLNFL